MEALIIRAVHAHARLARVDDGLSARAVHQDCLQLFKLICGQLLSVLDQFDNFCIKCILGNDLDQLWEVVGVPLADPHAEGVDVFVQLVEQGDALYDHVVALVDVELDLGPAVGV